MAISKTLNVNSERITATVDDPDVPLLYVLRDNLGLHGPHFGCGLAQCGACTVQVDGKAVRSCVMPLSSLGDGDKIVTLEGESRVQPMSSRGTSRHSFVRRRRRLALSRGCQCLMPQASQLVSLSTSTAQRARRATSNGLLELIPGISRRCMAG
jgi:aerobic-type carbon monoxide dehydrogenase small subunit (CoxS/CutS family)